MKLKWYFLCDLYVPADCQMLKPANLNPLHVSMSYRISVRRDQAPRGHHIVITVEVQLLRTCVWF